MELINEFYMSIKNNIIPEYKVELIPLSEESVRSRGFPMSDPEIWNRSKIGGKPTFIQTCDYPICSNCGKYDFLCSIRCNKG